MIRKLSLILCAVIFLTLASCGIDPIIPEKSESASSFQDQIVLFENAVAEISKLDYDCMISKTEYFRPDGSGDYVGVYIQNMSDQSISPYDGAAVKAILSSGIKMIDLIRRDGMTIVSFSLCIPGRSLDYGYYYCSEGKAVYLGDTAAALTQTETGYTYTKRSAFGTGATYYTEQLSEFFFYYEIN